MGLHRSSIFFVLAFVSIVPCTDSSQSVDSVGLFFTRRLFTVQSYFCYDFDWAFCFCFILISIALLVALFFFIFYCSCYSLWMLPLFQLDFSIVCVQCNFTTFTIVNKPTENYIDRCTSLLVLYCCMYIVYAISGRFFSGPYYYMAVICRQITWNATHGRSKATETKETNNWCSNDMRKSNSRKINYPFSKIFNSKQSFTQLLLNAPFFTIAFIFFGSLIRSSFFLVLSLVLHVKFFFYRGNKE